MTENPNAYAFRDYYGTESNTTSDGLNDDVRRIINLAESLGMGANSSKRFSKNPFYGREKVAKKKAKKRANKSRRQNRK